MRRAALLPLVLFVSFCAGGRGTPNISVPGHGALTITIVPNPVAASKVSGSTYDFPFDVVLRETGGHPIDVVSITATVTALGGIQVAQESYDAAKITSMGYSTHIPANGELHYRFNPRRDVTNDLLFQGVSANIRVDGSDDTGTPATAGTRVSVTRG
jgi:hypothetical protein